MSATGPPALPPAFKRPPEGPSTEDPSTQESHLDHGVGFLTTEATIKSKHFRREELMLMEDTRFYQWLLAAKQLLHGAKERKLQTLTLSPLLGGSSFGWAFGRSLKPPEFARQISRQSPQQFSGIPAGGSYSWSGEISSLQILGVPCQCAKHCKTRTGGVKTYRTLEGGAELARKLPLKDLEFGPSNWRFFSIELL